MEKAGLALALGGGAARGWAHIGVLKVLDAAGIRPDIIAGTSIGAVVGGCYAAGKLDELENYARSLTLRSMIRQLDFTLPGSSFISGDRIARRLNQHLSHIRIEHLSPRFIAVATELGTGCEVWLNKGPLVPALQASYALPGILKPMRINGRWLMDGAFVNPVPVSVCRALGARYVIAVNLHNGMVSRSSHLPRQETVNAEEAYCDAVETASRGRLNPMRYLRRQLLGRKEQAPAITRVMLEAFNITQDRIARSRLAGDPPDLIVTPRLEGFGLFDFHKAGDAIARGEEIALRHIEDIVRAAKAAGAEARIAYPVAM